MCEGKAAVVLSVGTELTEGIIQDTHIRFLSSELTSLGFTVCRGVQIPDNPRQFTEEVERALHEASLLILTGGLGPTTDDLTREIVARAAGAPLEFHREVWDSIVERFKGRKVSDTNRKQAEAPRGFPLLPNPNGTAPGFYGQIGGALVVALPGPPSELRPMFTQSVVPVLAERFGSASARDILWGTALMVPESNLEEALRTARQGGISWGTRVDEDRISFSLRGGTADEREACFASLASSLGPTRIRRGETRPAQLLSDALLDRMITVVTAESCTGGLIGKYMTDLAGQLARLLGRLRQLLERGKSRHDRRGRADPGKLGRGFRGSRHRDGARRVVPVRGGDQHGGLGYCRSGRRFGGQAGRDGVDCGCASERRNSGTALQLFRLPRHDPSKNRGGRNAFRGGHALGPGLP